MSRRLVLDVSLLAVRVLSVAVLLAVLVHATAGAQTTPQPITNYVDYPAVVEGVPAGCAAPALTDLAFSLNGSPSQGELSALPGFKAGDRLHMAWTGQTAGCEGTVVTLAIKHATQPTFDPGEDQELVAFSSTVADGLGGLILDLPDLTAYDEGPCNYQVDAVVGPPLSIVGPDGSFYGPLPFPPRNGTGRDMLISARNGAYTQCTPTTTTSTTVDTAPPASGEGAPPESPTPGPGEPSTSGGGPERSESPSAAPAAAALPATGLSGDIAWLAPLAGFLIALGGIAVYVTAAYHRKGGRP